MTPPFCRPRLGWLTIGFEGNGAYDQEEGVADAVGVTVDVMVELSSDEESVEDVSGLVTVDVAAEDAFDEVASGTSVGVTPSTK